MTNEPNAAVNATETNSMSPWSMLVSIFYEPTKVFRAIKEKPTWIIPLIVFLVVMTGATYFMMPAAQKSQMRTDRAVGCLHRRAEGRNQDANGSKPGIRNDRSNLIPDRLDNLPVYRRRHLDAHGERDLWRKSAIRASFCYGHLVFYDVGGCQYHKDAADRSRRIRSTCEHRWRSYCQARQTPDRCTPSSIPSPTSS